MIFLVPKQSISVRDIAKLRKLCGNSISEIKQASEQRKPVVEIEPFTSNWDADKVYLAKLYRFLAKQAPAPFEVFEGDSPDNAEFLSPEVFYNRLVSLREIELEQQRQIDLEMGYINDSEEFQPHDQDWL